MLPHNAQPHFKALAALLADRESLFVYSGFLTDQKQETEQAIAGAGLSVQRFGQMNEWGAVAAKLMRE